MQKTHTTKLQSWMSHMVQNRQVSQAGIQNTASQSLSHLSSYLLGVLFQWGLSLHEWYCERPPWLCYIILGPGNSFFFFFKLAFVSDFSLLKARSYSITQAGTKITKELAWPGTHGNSLLPPTPKCWDYRRKPRQLGWPQIRIQVSESSTVFLTMLVSDLNQKLGYRTFGEDWNWFYSQRKSLNNVDKSDKIKIWF